MALTLGDFVRQLAASLNDRDIKMPFKNEKGWHVLFYNLKTTEAKPGKPVFFNQLFFDWDGPYPKCKELSEFLHALHWNAGVSAENPRYEKIELDSAIAGLWKEKKKDLPPDDLIFLEDAVKQASELFMAPA